MKGYDTLRHATKRDAGLPRTDRNRPDRNPLDRNRPGRGYASRTPAPVPPVPLPAYTERISTVRLRPIIVTRSPASTFGPSPGGTPSGREVSMTIRHWLP